MEVALILVVFFAAGAVLANFFSAAKFSIFALAGSLAYLAFTLSATGGGIGSALLRAAAGFVCIQFGYVGGLAIKTAYARYFPQSALPYLRMTEEEDSQLK